MAEKIHRGDVKRFAAWYKNQITDTYQDPDAGTKEMKFINPSGVTVATIADGSFTKESAGKFYYDWTIPSDAPYGDWTYTIKGKIGTAEEIEEFFFTVEKLR